MRKTLGISFGALVVVGVLVWGLAFGGFPAGTSIQPIIPGGNNTHNSTNGSNGSEPENPTQVEITGKSTLKTGSVEIGSLADPYQVGESIVSYVRFQNGKATSIDYSVICRQPDNAKEGYVKAPHDALEWFQVDPDITLASGTEVSIPVTLYIPLGVPDDRLTIYYLKPEGRVYLDDAINRTVASEDALAAAFKEELSSFPEVQAGFDELYANRGDKYVFKAIWDGFPYLYGELVDAWERAIDNVVGDLSSIPYATTLYTLDLLGSVSEAMRGSYPELSTLPSQYVATSDLRTQPWEVWISISESYGGMVVTDVNCRYLVTMG